MVAAACSAPRYNPQYFWVNALFDVLQPSTEAPAIKHSVQVLCFAIGIQIRSFKNLKCVNTSNSQIVFQLPLIIGLLKLLCCVFGPTSLNVIHSFIHSFMSFAGQKHLFGFCTNYFIKYDEKKCARNVETHIFCPGLLVCMMEYFKGGTLCLG